MLRGLPQDDWSDEVSRRLLAVKMMGGAACPLEGRGGPSRFGWIDACLRRCMDRRVWLGRSGVQPLGHPRRAGSVAAEALAPLDVGPILSPAPRVDGHRWTSPDFHVLHVSSPERSPCRVVSGVHVRSARRAGSVRRATPTKSVRWIRPGRSIRSARSLSTPDGRWCRRATFGRGVEGIAERPACVGSAKRHQRTRCRFAAPRRARGTDSSPSRRV